ncbi:MAG TPA: phage tail protein [Polyangia bacterium]|nr:phage tail protein [Polyangia bacterium]
MSPLPVGLNAAITAGAPAVGKRLDPYAAHNFLVEIEGLLVGGFTHVSGLEGSIATDDRVEGGVNGFVHKIFKETTYPNLVLSHGLIDIDSLWGWFDRTSRGIIRRKHGTIMLLDAQRLPVMWWDFLDALPVKWSGPAFDAAQDGQVAIESVELIHRGLTKPLLSQLASAARLIGKAAT